MVRLRPKDTELVNILASFGKAYFTVADLERILGLPRRSALVTLHRLVKSGLLIRLRRNVYTVFTETVDAEKIVNELYFPCYLSFEGALARHGILSQLPFTLRFATTHVSKRITIGSTEVELSHLKPELFFGYILNNGRQVAEPEKALLDQLYLASRGRVALHLEELDLRAINKDKFTAYAGKFPRNMEPLLDKIEKYLGTTPITLEDGERIKWGKK